MDIAQRAFVELSARARPFRVYGCELAVGLPHRWLTMTDPVGAAIGLEQLLADCQRVLGPDHPHTLTTRANLARWRRETEGPVGAVTAFEQLLADRLRVLGSDHLDTLMTRHDLAYWRGEAGDPAGAATALEQLLADRQRVLGSAKKPEAVQELAEPMLGQPGYEK